MKANTASVLFSLVFVGSLNLSRTACEYMEPILTFRRVIFIYQNIVCDPFLSFLHVPGS